MEDALMKLAVGRQDVIEGQIEARPGPADNRETPELLFRAV
ncbi:MAG: hypothetical protein V9G11_04815 [Bifidobacterium adolescentis]